MQSKQDPNARRSGRVLKRIPIFVRGRVPEGKPFSEEAYTLVVNAHGGLISLATSVETGQKLLLTNKESGEDRECCVIYQGGKEGDRAAVGIEFTSPEPEFWRLAFPPADWEPERKPSSAPGQERRLYPRYRCSGRVDLCVEGQKAVLRIALSDVSLGGCYLETMSPLPVSTRVQLILRAQKLEVQAGGVVQTSYPHLGMGIAFTELSQEDQRRLEQLINRAVASSTPP